MKRPAKRFQTVQSSESSSSEDESSSSADETSAAGANTINLAAAALRMKKRTGISVESNYFLLYKLKAFDAF